MAIRAPDGANKQIQRQMQSVRHKRLLHIFVWVRLNPPVQWGLFRGQLLLDFLIEMHPETKMQSLSLEKVRKRLVCKRMFADAGNIRLSGKTVK